MNRAIKANHLNELKRIERLALEELEICTKGKWYDGREAAIERLQKIARDARIKRLELELYETNDQI